MNNTLGLLFSLFAGVLLGTVFFGGLWFTVRRGLTSQSAGSLVSRQHVAANCDCRFWLLFRNARRLAAIGRLPVWISAGACLCPAPDS